jgi:PTS system nitrogen regulatory IIA component
MPYQLLDVAAVADYLHLTASDIEQRVRDREIPFERRGDRIMFRKSEIDAWASRRILGFAAARLAVYHEKSTRASQMILAHQAILPAMLQAGAVASDMTSKTKSSILHDLVVLADKTGQLNDPRTLLASLQAREEMCPTAIPGGFALPHPRSPEPYLFESSFIVVGRPIQEIFLRRPRWRADPAVFPDLLPGRPPASAHLGPLVPDRAEDQHSGAIARRSSRSSHARRRPCRGRGHP